jgi:hypothetical protein
MGERQRNGQAETEKGDREPVRERDRGSGRGTETVKQIDIQTAIETDGQADGHTDR